MSDLAPAAQIEWSQTIKIVFVDPPMQVGSLRVGDVQLPMMRLKLPDGGEIAWLVSPQSAQLIGRALLEGGLPQGQEVSELRMN